MNVSLLFFDQKQGKVFHFKNMSRNKCIYERNYGFEGLYFKINNLLKIKYYLGGFPIMVISYIYFLIFDHWFQVS